MSVSEEVRILQNIVKNDVQSVTGKNCLKLSQEFSLDPNRDNAALFHEDYTFYALPEQDDWRIPLLNTLLIQRYEMSACGEDLESLWAHGVTVLVLISFIFF